MGMTLKALRVNKGLTQEQLAKELNVTSDTISNWERAITFPNVIQIKSITDFYQVSFDDIIFLPNTSV